MISYPTPLETRFVAALIVLCTWFAPGAQAQTWTGADVGAVFAAGSDSGSGSSATVTGSGADIWETTDEFHYRYQNWTGDGTFITRVPSMTNTHTWAKAGIMLRESLAPDARHIMVCVNPGNAAGFFARATTGGATDFVLGVYEIPSMWIRLIRSGNSFAAAQSADGVNWVPIGSAVTINVPTQLLAGLAVTSHNDGVLCTATFDNISFAGPAAPPTNPPTAPSNLNAVEIFADSVRLTWTDNSSNETGFSVERSINDTSNFREIWTTTIGRYTDFGLSAGALYYYRVRAMGSSGNSTYSNVVSVRPEFLPPPTNLSALMLPDRLHLRWTDNTDQETGYAIDTMPVQRDAVFSRVGLVAANVTQFTFSGIPGTSYIYRVYAVKGNVSSTFVEGSSVIPTTPMLSVVNVAQTTIGLYWEDPTVSISGPQTWSYSLERSTNGSTYTVIAGNIQGGRPGTSFTDTGLSGQTRYFYRVRHLDSAGNESAYSNAVSPTTLAGTAPVAPSNLLARALSPDRVDLTWQDNSSIETNVQIERSFDNFTFTQVATLGANITQYTDATVNGSTTYYYRIMAYNGQVSFHSALTYSGPVTTPATPPTGDVWQSRDIGGVAATGSDTTSGTTMTVTGSGRDIWNTDDEFRYRFQAFTGDGEIVARVSSLTNTHGWAKAGLMFRESLDFGSRHAWMCVSTDHGTAFQYRPATGAETVSTPPSEDGGPPRWLKIVRSGDRFTGFESHDGSTWFQRGTTTLPGTRATIYVGLAVTSHNDGILCTGRFENVSVSAPPPQPMVPAPTGLVALATSAGMISLSWTDNTSDETGLTVQRSSDNIFFSHLVSGGPNFRAWSDSTVSAGTRYYYRVFAQRGDVTSVYSNTASATTFTPAPNLPAPSNVRATVVSSTRIDLNWSDNSLDETSFEIERSNGSGIYAFIGTGSPNNPSWADHTVVPSTQYFYRMFTRRNGEVSAYTAPVGVMTSSNSPPPVAPSGLTATVVSAARIDLNWVDNSTDETLFRIERSTDNVNFTNLQSVGPNIRTWADTTVAASTTYYYRVAARRNEDVSTFSNTASGTTRSTPPPPIPTWQSQDVGDVAIAGDTLEATGAIALTGSGADIWNTADEFRYRYQAWTGDGEIIARVTGLSNTNGWAKAGVMFRESLTGPSRHAWMCVSIAHGSAFQYRATTGGESASAPPSESGGFRQWIRLVRAGNTFTGYASLDGVTWTLAGSTTVVLPATIFVGLAVTSHNDGALCTATFDNISVLGGVPPPTSPPAAPINLIATAVSTSRIDLSWTDTSNNEIGFEIESSTDNITFARLTTTSANTTSFAHTGLSSSTRYYYRVRAVNAAGASAFSNLVVATTHAAPPPPPPGAWQSQDIGAVAVAGSTTNESGNSVMLSGSGADIWNTADEFRYRYQTWTGDGELVARVATLTNTNGWAKAGVMFRATLDGNSRHVWMCISMAHGTAMQFRITTNGESSTTAPSEVGTVPRWVRLVRTGNSFTGYASYDGANWTEAGTVVLDLPATVFAGVAVTSHNDGIVATAAFENVTLTAGSAPPPPTTVNAPTALGATATSGSQVQLQWSDNSTNETAFQIERSVDGATFALLFSTPPSQTTYADNAVGPGTLYYYRVRAVAGGVPSPYTNTVFTTTPNTPAPPNAWSQADIGSVGVAGSNSSGGNTITIQGSGNDVWDTADGFRFVYRTLTGDCVVEAQVSGLGNTHAWAKAGVMIRESAAANARNVFALVTAGNGVGSQARTSTGGATTFAGGPWGATVPYWVRLTRTGSTIVASASANGSNWTVMGTYNVSMDGPVLVGFAVTSHNNGVLNTATFTDPFIQP